MYDKGAAAQPHEQETKSLRDRAIVVVSVGDRDWLPEVTELAGFYARRCGAELIVERTAPSAEEFPLAEMPDSPGRPHKRVYACKSFFAWKHMVQTGYRKVLVLDDTCCISARAPDIFRFAEDATVLYTETGHQDALRSFADIQDFVSRQGLAPITYDPALYMNSGVLLYDAGMAHAIHPDRIVAAADLLYSHFPHQSLCYYLLRRGHVRMKSVDRRFNRVPAVGLDKQLRREIDDIIPHLQSGVYIHHVTGMYRKRDLLIRQIHSVLIDEWLSIGA